MNPTACCAATTLALLMPAAAMAQTASPAGFGVVERIQIEEVRGLRVSSSIKVYDSGKIEHRHGKVGSPQLIQSTVATDAELAALTRALEAARLDRILPALHPWEEYPQYSLILSPHDAPLQRITATRGKEDAAHKAQLDPIHQALDGIWNRANGLTLRGVVKTRPRTNQVGLMVNGRWTQVVPTRFARSLRKFEGHEVVVSGSPTNLAGPPAYSAKSLLSPVRKEITGRVRVAKNGAVWLTERGTTPSRRFAAFGPGAEVAGRHASGTEVNALAYVFEDDPRGTPAYVIGIVATVLHPSQLKIDGEIVRLAPPGARLLVTRVVRRGRLAVVNHHYETQLNKLQLGRPVAQRAGTSRGLTDHLGATTKRP